MIHSFIYIMILDIDIEREIITKSAINQKFACNTPTYVCHFHFYIYAPSRCIYELS